jgi:hypothetical protein
MAVGPIAGRARRPVRRAREPSLSLEARTTALARAGAPLRRALARIAARLVEARAWERLGFARLADYAGERAGMSARQIQELASVDRALARLPAIEAAFVAGRISWSKARDLCRVATPEDEPLWLDAALRLTARALEREVRAVDRRALAAVERADPPAEIAAPPVDEDGWVILEDRETVDLRVAPLARAKWWRARQLAQRVAGQRLSHAQCAEWVAAEVLSAIALEGDLAAPAVVGPVRARERPGVSHDEPAEAPPPPATAESPAPSPFLDALVRGLDGADAFELDRRLRRAARLEQRLMAELAPGLLDVARGRLHRAMGFAALDGWARERLGMSPRKAQALLRLARAGEVCPALREAFAAGHLSWRQAHVLVALVLLEHSLPHRRAWIERAARVSLRRLEDEVAFALDHDVLDPHACARAMDSARARLTSPEATSAPTLAELLADPHACARFRGRGRATERVRLFFCAPRGVSQLFRATLATMQRRIERREGRTASPSEALEAMLDHALASWTALSALHPREHFVFVRDGFRCTVPGCSSYRELQAHHIWWRSAGGGDEERNLVTLCAFHHLRGVHARTICVTGRAPEELLFELGLCAGMPPLARFTGGEVRV